MIRVGLVDNHKGVAEGYQRLIELNEAFTFVQGFSTFDEVINFPTLNELNVMLVDIALDDKSGIALIKEIKTMSPNVNCIALSVFDKEPYISDALSAGAHGYLSKRSGAAEIENAILSAANQDFYLSPDVEKNYLGITDNQHEMSLSNRELEILKLLAKGYEIKEAAYQLDIAGKTAHAHKANIYLKLGMKTRKDLMQYALIHQHSNLEDILQQ